MQGLFHDTSNWHCISPQYRCSRLAAILFRIAAKAIGAVHFHLVVMARWYPVKLFLLTGSHDEAQTVFDDPICTRDSFSKEFLADYPTLEDTEGIRAQAELHAIQLDARCDTIPIEQGHADDRRTTMMSLTYKKTYADIFGDGLIHRQGVREREYAPPVVPQDADKGHARRKQGPRGEPRAALMDRPQPKAKALSMSARNIQRRVRRKEKKKYDGRTFSGYNLFCQEVCTGKAFIPGTSPSTAVAWQQTGEDVKQSYARRAKLTGVQSVSSLALKAQQANLKQHAIMSSLSVDHSVVQRAYKNMDTDLDLKERLRVLDQAAKEQASLALDRKRALAQAASEWSRNISDSSFFMRLDNAPTSPMFRRHATSFPGQVFEVVPKMNTLLRRGVLHSSAETRKTLTDVFARSSSMVCSSSLVDLGDVPQHKQSLCYYARRCVCSSLEGNRWHGSYQS